MRPLILLSPAKTLNFEAALSPALAKAAATAPHYLSDAHALAASLGTLSQAELGKLMSLSASLASLNHARYADFTSQPTRIAAAAFEGPAYKGLDAASLESEQLSYLQVGSGFGLGLRLRLGFGLGLGLALGLELEQLSYLQGSLRILCNLHLLTSPYISPISRAGLAAHPVRPVRRAAPARPDPACISPRSRLYLPISPLYLP